jgi:putative NADPH-quinone reductase
MSKVMIVVGHSQKDTFCEAIGRSYEEGAASAGHEARIFLLATMAFDPILREGYQKEQPLEPDLSEAYSYLTACDHLVLVFPLWCGDMPALLKGFIERILQPDLVSRQKTEHAMNRSIFKNKTARIVITMGMPVSIYRFWYGAHTLKLLTHNVLQFIGIKPVRHTLFGMVTTCKQQKRERWLKDVRAFGRAAA